MSGLTAFPRGSRLLRPEEFSRVFDDAPFRSTGVFLVVLARPNGLNTPRLGLAVSKKHIKTAVQRNRVKRLIRETFRLRQAVLGAFDYVAIARAPARLASRTDLLAALDRQWAEITP